MKFSLATVAYVFALLAAGMAALGVPLGVLASLFVLGYWWWNPRWPATVIELWTIVLVILVVIGLLLPTIDTPRESSRVMACGGDLRFLARALQEYQTMNRRLPPAGDANSNTMSWRVAILPWLESNDLYKNYRRDESWNSPSNAQVASQRLVCPSDPGLTVGTPQTNYFAIVGGRTVWGDGWEPPALNDASSQTIMLIEAAGLSIPWAQPRDLSFDEAVKLLTGQSQNQVMHPRRPEPGFFEKGYGQRQEGLHVAFADGEIGFVPIPISKELATAMLTANGGEAIARHVTEQFRVPQTDYGKMYALFVFVLLSLLPGAMRVVRRARSSEDSPAS
jgi:hypothetical protein